MRADASVLVFTHIPKASGTTLSKVLEQTFAPAEIFRLYEVPGKTREEQESELAEIAGRSPCPLKIVLGHSPYGVHRLLAQPVQYFTVLRDPIERVVSDYFYIRRQKGHRLHDEVSGGSLTLTELARRLPNRQTRFIGGVRDGNPESADLGRAIQNVDESYRVAGLVERFDETLALIQRRFDLPFRSYTRHNVTTERPACDSLSADERKVIEGCNQLDLALYDHVRRRFEDEVAADGAALQEHAARLKIESTPKWWQKLLGTAGLIV